MPKLDAHKLHPLSSSGDHMGRIYSYDGTDTRVYRLVHKERMREVTSYLENKVIRRLLGQSLIATKIESRLEGPNGEMVLSHPKLAMVSYPYEWSAAMLQDAGSMVGKLLEDLGSAGYTLSDPHAFNVTFVGGEPIYLDFGSLTSINKTYDARKTIRDLHENFIFPCLISKYTRERTWQQYFKVSGIQKIRLSDVYRKIGLRHPSVTIRESLHMYENIRNNASNQLIKLNDELKSLDYENMQTKWGTYDQESGYDKKRITSPKEKTFLSLLQQTKSLKNICDIGGNTGHYLDLAKQHFPHIETILVDGDEAAINAAYLKHAYTHTALISFEDLDQPLHYRDFPGNPNPSFLSRKKFTMVVVLALIHHLLYTNNTSLTRICEILKACQTRYYLLEFIPPNDPKIRNWHIKKKKQITRAMFDEALGGVARKIAELPSSVKGRSLILYQKIV